MPSSRNSPPPAKKVKFDDNVEEYPGMTCLDVMQFKQGPRQRTPSKLKSILQRKLPKISNSPVKQKPVDKNDAQALANYPPYHDLMKVKATLDDEIFPEFCEIIAQFESEVIDDQEEVERLTAKMKAMLKQIRTLAIRMESINNAILCTKGPRQVRKRLNWLFGNIQKYYGNMEILLKICTTGTPAEGNRAAIKAKQLESYPIYKLLRYYENLVEMMKNRYEGFCRDLVEEEEYSDADLHQDLTLLIQLYGQVRKAVEDVLYDPSDPYYKDLTWMKNRLIKLLDKDLMDQKLKNPFLQTCTRKGMGKIAANKLLEKLKLPKIDELYEQLVAPVPSPKPQQKPATPKRPPKLTTPKPPKKLATPKPQKPATPKPPRKLETPKPQQKPATPKPPQKPATPKPPPKPATPKPPPKTTTPQPPKLTTPKPPQKPATPKPSPKPATLQPPQRPSSMPQKLATPKPPQIPAMLLQKPMFLQMTPTGLPQAVLSALDCVVSHPRSKSRTFGPHVLLKVPLSTRPAALDAMKRTFAKNLSPGLTIKEGITAAGIFAQYLQNTKEMLLPDSVRKMPLENMNKTSLLEILGARRFQRLKEIMERLSLFAKLQDGEISTLAKVVGPRISHCHRYGRTTGYQMVEYMMKNYKKVFC